jgi:hypothetical protein
MPRISVIRRLLTVTLVAVAVSGGAATLAGPASAATSKSLSIAWEAQINYYYCGPAATRMAMKARTSSPPSQTTIGKYLGTDVNGTDDIGNVVGALNHFLNTGWYEAKYISYSATQAQHDLLKSDAVFDVDRDYALVANIWIVPGGMHPPGYPSYEVMHYVTIIGYGNSGESVQVADPAAGLGDFANVPHTYWVSTWDMANMIGGKGYAA